jgi:hypothetical protein
MSLAVIAAIFRGFARSYFLRSHYFSTPLALIAKVHGAVFLSWAGLLLVQTVLVARRRTDLHRRLGLVGAVLAGAMVVVGTAIAIVSLRKRASCSSPPSAYWTQRSRDGRSRSWRTGRLRSSR